MEIIIRSELVEDYKKITVINDLALEGTGESKLIEKLRDTPLFNPELSLVAEIKNKLVGHILFYPIEIVSDKNFYGSISLGPMAVIPECQREGIGTALVEKGIERVKNGV
jgi:putative acetyltransferase